MAKLFRYILDILKQKGVKKYSINTFWLVSDKITGMLLGFAVGIWVARYLGPEKLGMIDYAFALTGLLAPISALGLSAIVTRDIAKNEEDQDVLISTAIGLRLIGGLFITIIVSLYLLITKKELVYFYLGLIAALQILTQSGDIIQDYFRAKVNTKFIFISRLAGYILSSLLKVSFILLGFGVLQFAGARMSLFLFTLIFLLYFLRKEQVTVSIKKFVFKKAIILLKESWPLIFSGIFALIYLQVDKIMIEEMLNSYELGQYSVAAKISSLWFFIPLTIRSSILPAFVNAKKTDENLYYKRLNIVFGIMALVSYLIVVPVFLFSEDIISILYGSQYAAAGKVLAIHIFSITFFFLGIGRGLWTVNESYFKFDLFANIGAGLLNIVLNFILLPNFGIIGAAYATVFSYSFTFFFSNLFFNPARKIFVMQLKAIFLISLIKKLKEDL